MVIDPFFAIPAAMVLAIASFFLFRLDDVSPRTFGILMMVSLLLVISPLIVLITLQIIQNLGKTGTAIISAITLLWAWLFYYTITNIHDIRIAIKNIRQEQALLLHKMKDDE